MRGGGARGPLQGRQGHCRSNLNLQADPFPPKYLAGRLNAKAVTW